MDHRHDIRRTSIICALIALLTLTCYWPVLRSGFINFDDPEYVTENPHVTSGLTGENVLWAFQTGYAGNWHPLTWLSHILDAQWFGLNPAGHHLTSLLLHTVNSLLLFLLFQQMTGTTWRSACVASLFALHPLHVESVAWVSERKDVLSGFFFMLTLMAYSRYAREALPHSQKSQSPQQLKTTSRSWIFYLLSCLFLALGLMSKPMLVTVPFLMLLIDAWPLNRFRTTAELKALLPRLLTEKIPFFLLGLAASIVTYQVQHKQGAVSSMEGLPFACRLENAVSSYFYYIAKMIWPTRLAVFYPHPDTTYPVSNQWPVWQILCGAILLALISVLSLRMLPRKPYLATGWFWFIGMLVPVIGIIQVGAQAMADRYTYLPMIGLSCTLVWALHDWLHQQIQPWLGVAGIAAIACCAALTSFQLRYWRDSISLFEHALAVTSQNATAHFNLGAAYEEKGKIGLAMANYRVAVKIDPAYADAYYNIGHALAEAGKLAEAVEQYRTVLSLKPDHSAAHNNLGNALLGLGRPEEAKAQYQEAIRLQPDYPAGHNNLGKILVDQGEFAEAEVQFTTALKLKPTYAEARSGLALCLAAQGKYADSLSHWLEVVKQRSDNAEVHFNLGNVLTELGRGQEAKKEYEAALRLQPDLARNHLDAGKSLASAGNLEAARARFVCAIRLKPDDPDAHEQLALINVRRGDLQGAISEFVEVIRLRPDAIAQYHLGLAQVMAGNFVEAIAAYRAALLLDPDLPDALNDLAWIRATHSREQFRDGPEAVRMAERAFQLKPEARYCGTLDAAYAESGRFETAIKTALKTRELALAAGQTEIAAAADQRLALYQAGKPFRQAPPSEDAPKGSQ